MIGVNKLDGLRFSAFSGAQQGNLDHTLNFSVLGLDATITWEEATLFAISRDGAQNAWIAGHINALLPRDDTIFVAADTGGIWGIDRKQTGAPAGNSTDEFDNPDFNCLSFGLAPGLQIYAGNTGPTPGSGLLLGGLGPWHPIQIVNERGTPLATGTVNRIVVLPTRRIIALATDNGVFWSNIPGPQPYAFRGGVGLTTRISDIAVGPDETLLAAAWGDDGGGGIFRGVWSNSQLFFSPSSMGRDIDVREMRRTSIASCASQPSLMYAISAKKDESLYRVMKSVDGGIFWDRQLTSAVGPGSKSGALEDANVTGLQGDYNNCIAVSPFNPSIVAIGWRNGPWISRDGGSSWFAHHLDDDTPQLHSDLHALYFDPSDASSQTLFVGSDGGLVVTRDLGANFSGEFNARLLNLQFYSDEAPGNPVRGSISTGGISASPVNGGLIAGPTQDNGNLFADLDNVDANAWQQLDGGDGVITRFLSNGLLLRVTPGDTKEEIVGKLARWSGSGFVEDTIVPSRRPSSKSLFISGDVAAVEKPHFRETETDKLMYAVAATENAIGERKNIYGLFSDGTVASSVWDLIATLPIASDDKITSVASLNGDGVIVGTQNGRIFSLVPFQEPIEFSVQTSKPGRIYNIVLVSDSDAIASALFDGPSNRAILQLSSSGWVPLGGNDGVAAGKGLSIGSETFTALILDREPSISTLFAATDSQIFISRDLGETWKLTDKGLPHRPHCRSFAIGAPRKNGSRYLYLGTYGRSVWQARIG
jgi:hypothetical protein